MSERGSVTVWMMGLAGLVVVVAGLAVDVWRLVEAREALAARVDAAATAVASTVDEDAWRENGTPVVDPAGCGRIEDSVPESTTVSCEVGGDEVDIAMSTTVELTLLRPLHPAPVEVRARARARAIRP